MSRSTPRLTLPLALLAAIAVTQCGDNSPLAPEGRPEPDVPVTPAPSADISDAAHNDGNPFVYLLPPLVEAPSPTGTFDPSLTPEVRICESDLSDCTAPPFLTLVSGDASDEVRMVPEDEHYVVNWDTGAWNLSTSTSYRIAIWQESFLLAFVDVQLNGQGGALNAQTDDAFQLRDGRTLPIKVRIEEGAAAFAPAQAESEDGQAAVDVPPGALTEFEELTVEPVDETDPTVELPDDGTAIGGTVYDFGPDGLEFEEPVELQLAIPPAEELPVGVIREQLRVYLAGPDGWELLPGEVEGDVVTGLTTHFSNFAILPGGVDNCDGSGFATLEEALAAVGPEGTITVCDGTYSLNQVTIDKRVTIEGETGSRPTLAFQTALGFITDFDMGTVTIRNLRLESLVANAAIIIPGSTFGNRGSPSYDQVVLEDLDLVVSQGDAIVPTESGVSGARVTISNVTVTTAGGFGVVAVNRISGGEGPRVDVLNSSFTNARIEYRRGASGLIQGNTLAACGSLYCIRVAGPTSGEIQVEPMRVIGNTMTATVANETEFGIRLDAGYGQAFEIRDNTIDGVAPPPGGDPSRDDPAVYSFYGDGIRIENILNPVAADVVSGNSVSSANVGITVDGDTPPFVGYPTGLDNVVDAVRVAIQLLNNGHLAIHSSDFTDYVVAIVDPTTHSHGGDMTCNYWGPGGPQGVDPGIAADVYAPWATTSVAGTSITDCPPVTYPAVTYCPGDSDPLTQESLETAVFITDPGGTVTVCDGTHTVQDVWVHKSVTIEGEAGFRPTLTLAGARWGIVLNPGPGTATIRNLRFDANYPNTSRAIRVNTNHDQVVIDDVELDVGLDGRSGVFVFQSTNDGARTVISNSTITGGSEGVFVWNGSGAQAGSSAVDVLNSTITGQNWNAIQYNMGGSGLVQGNTLSSCGPRACIRVTGDATRTQVEPMRVIGNTISATQNETRFGIVVNASYGQTYEVRDNVIGGDPVSGDPNDPASYSFHEAGIRIDNPTAAGDVSDNSVSSSNAGILVDGGAVQVTGLDNWLDWVRVGVWASNSGQLALHSSDFTNYVVPIDPTEPFGTGDLTCNWWGALTGPAGVDGGIASDVYLPWALEPVAGTSATSCSGGL